MYLVQLSEVTLIAKIALVTIVVIFIINPLCLASPLVLATLTGPCPQRVHRLAGDRCVCQQLTGHQRDFKATAPGNHETGLVSQV